MVNYALTGTPGTGKTSLSKLLDQKVISLSEYYEEASDGKTKDGEWIVDIEKLDLLLGNTNCNIFEGHFAHKLSHVEKIIVLRCDPSILKNRLEVREYTVEKIRKNMEAEAIGIIYSEALEYLGKGNIIQIDNGNKTLKETAEIIQKYISDNIKVEEEIDYSERILDWY